MRCAQDHSAVTALPCLGVRYLEEEPRGESPPSAVEQEMCLWSAYFSEIGSSALRHAVNPPRRFATSCPADSRMLAARLERMPLAQ
jgi:hypothetical protein